MTSAKKQNWDFGSLDEPEPKPLPDEELLEKTRQATRAVGYGPPAEQNAKKKPPAAPKRLDRETPAMAARPRGRPRKQRTVALSTKVTSEQDAMLKAISEDGLVIADIVDEALTVFARDLVQKGRYKRIPLSEEAISSAKAVLGREGSTSKS